jgi:hypothetical protein
MLGALYVICIPKEIAKSASSPLKVTYPLGIELEDDDDLSDGDSEAVLDCRRTSGDMAKIKDAARQAQIISEELRTLDRFNSISVEKSLKAPETEIFEQTRIYVPLLNSPEVRNKGVMIFEFSTIPEQERANIKGELKKILKK